MRQTVFRVAVAALFALASTAGAVAENPLTTILWEFAHSPEEGVHRLAYAVEELGWDVNGEVRVGDFRLTPLCLARRAEFARELVRLGALPQGSLDGSYTLLQCASHYSLPGDATFIAWLIDEVGQDVNEMAATAADDRVTPLCAFARYGDLLHVKALLARGADPNLHVEGEASRTHPLACVLTNRRLPWEEMKLIVEALKEAGSSYPDSNGTREAPTSELPPVAAAPTLTGGAWVAEEPWIKNMEGDAVEVGTVHYKLTFTTSRFIHNTFSIESGNPQHTGESNQSGTWRADDTTITKVAWLFADGVGEPPSAVKYVKSYRFEDDGDTLVMTHWASERRPPIPTVRELRYTRVPDTSIIGSWVASYGYSDIEGTRSFIEEYLQVLGDGTFSFVQTKSPEGDADVTTISAQGRYTDDPDENFITLSDVTLNGAPAEGLRFAYASGYGDNKLSLSAFWEESEADTYPYGAYHMLLRREGT